MNTALFTRSLILAGVAISTGLGSPLPIGIDRDQYELIVGGLEFESSLIPVEDGFEVAEEFDPEADYIVFGTYSLLRKKKPQIDFQERSNIPSNYVQEDGNSKDIPDIRLNFVPSDAVIPPSYSETIMFRDNYISTTPPTFLRKPNYFSGFYKERPFPAVKVNVRGESEQKPIEVSSTTVPSAPKMTTLHRTFHFSSNMGKILENIAKKNNEKFLQYVQETTPSTTLVPPTELSYSDFGTPSSSSIRSESEEQYEPDRIVDTTFQNDDLPKLNEYSLLTVPNLKKGKCPDGQVRTENGECRIAYVHKPSKADGILAAATGFRMGSLTQNQPDEAPKSRKGVKSFIDILKSVESNALSSIKKTEQQTEVLKRILKYTYALSDIMVQKPNKKSNLKNFSTSTAPTVFEKEGSGLYTVYSRPTTSPPTSTTAASSPSSVPSESKPNNIFDILRTMSIRSNDRI